MGEAITVSRLEGGVVEITMHYGRVNALHTGELLTPIAAALEEAAGDESVRGVLVTSTRKVFSGGLDLNELGAGVGGGKEALAEYMEKVDKLLVSFATCPKPVAAAVCGSAIAGGAVVALACDYVSVLDSPQVRVGLTEIVLGVPVPPSVHAVIHQKLPPRGYRRLFVTGKPIPSRDAYACGFGDALISSGPAEVREDALSWLRARQAVSGGAFAAMKADSFRDAALRFPSSTDVKDRNVDIVLGTIMQKLNSKM
mmetsp:Transcript_33015/g.92416  ORF Transcript_33015/g.92416 Transcript_33015/m.92416 type:complete len:255 (+) Transcript_33015:49-813(+)